MSEEFTPLNDNVLLTVLEKVPEMYKAKVVAVGPGLATLGGRLKPRVRAGDVVLIDRYPVHWVFLGDEKFLLVNEHKIRLKVKDVR